MRVLITTSTFPLSEDDGMPRFVFDLAMGLAAACRVTVLAPHSPGAPFHERIGNLTIRRFQYSWPARTQCLAYGHGMRQNIRTSLAAGIQIPLYVASLARALHKLVRQERFDVINSHWLVPQGLAVSLAQGRSAAIPHIVTAHAGDVFLLERLWLGKAVAGFVAGRSDMFLPVSTHVAEGLGRLTSIEIPHCVQPMGAHHDRFSTPPVPGTLDLPFDGNCILFVGRLVEKKGLSCLLEALALLASRGKDAELVIVGSGLLRGALEDRVRQLNLGNRVKFLGAMAHKSILPYLHGCSVLAIPSIVDARGETEGMPTVLAEALAAGCKVVASRVGGVPDILTEGYNGWLAQPGSAADLADKLSHALSAPHDHIRDNARQTARQLDWKQICQRYLDCFEAAMNRKRKN